MKHFPDNFLPLLLRVLTAAEGDGYLEEEILAVFRQAYYNEIQHHLWHDHKDGDELTSIVVASWGHSSMVRLVATFSDGFRCEKAVENDPDALRLESALDDIIVEHNNRKAL